jgi:hypothetical protein
MKPSIVLFMPLRREVQDEFAIVIDHGMFWERGDDASFSKTGARNGRI